MATIGNPQYSVKVDGDRIIASTPFVLKDTCKSIPGAKWDAELKCWTWPATPHAAESVNSRMPERIGRSESFRQLLNKAKVAAEIDTGIKFADELPDVPNTKLPAWLHQRQAYWFAQSKPATMLAMDMGTGKTKVAIDLIQNSDARRVLILCPKSVIPVWPREFGKHYSGKLPIVTITFERSNTVADKARWLADSYASLMGKNLAVFIMNYEAAWREPMAKALLQRSWDWIICDESHRVKSPQGKASKFVAKLAAKSERRLALTGTPMPHTPMDIFAQYRFLDTSIFGTNWTAFKHNYATWGGYGGYELTGYQNEDDLNRRVYSIAYRVGKEVLDLPPFVHVERTFILEGKARQFYNELENDFVTWLGGDGSDEPVTVGNALVKLLRLQQITSGYLPRESGDTEPVLLHEQKADLLADVCEDIAQDEAIVVFCRFRHDIDAIKKKLSGTRPCYELSGRRNELDIWQNGTAGGCVLIAQIGAGAEGVDLTRARYCIYYSLGFSLGQYEQSLARVHRPGQTRSTTYIHLIAEGTVDRKVYNALDSRREVVEAILEELR